MNNTLIEIPKYEPEQNRVYQDGELAAESAAFTERKTLEKVGETAAERKAREKAEAELAKLEQARQDKIDGVNKLNQLWDQHERLLEDEKRAQDFLAGAREQIEWVKGEIAVKGFEGCHGQLGRSVRPSYGWEMGMIVAGARFVIDEVYPEWTKKNAAKIVEVKAQIIELATKLGIAHELPKGFIEQ